jgi:hypothetical protein
MHAAPFSGGFTLRVSSTVAVASAAAALFLGPPRAEAGYAGYQGSWVFTHQADLPGADNSEIVAYDRDTRRIYVAGGSGVDVLDHTGTKLFGLGGNGPQGPGAPYFTTTVTSVAVGKGVIAVAGETRHFTPAGGDTFTESAYGAVRFYTTDGEFIREVQVAEEGNVPDTVSFTPNGRYVLTAIEGEGGDPGEGAIGVIDAKSGRFTRLSFDAFESQRTALSAQGVLLIDSQSLNAQFQPEFIAISKDGHTAFVTLEEQNAVAVVALKGEPRITRIFSAGFLDRGLPGFGFDPSDRDGRTAVRTYPNVFSSSEPDQIAWFKIKGQGYVATANEGDDGVLNASGYISPFTAADLDQDRFPDRDAVMTNAHLGRIAKVGRDTDGDGDVDEIYTSGSRSVSIFREDGTLVWNSGDLFEQALIARNVLDESRSDNRGPEAEGVTVGRIDGSTYLFVGLEKGRAIVVLDVTDPASPALVDVIVSDLSEPLNEPEGLAFVAADASWDGQPYLVVSSEASGQTFLFRLLTD